MREARKSIRTLAVGENSSDTLEVADREKKNVKGPERRSWACHKGVSATEKMHMR